MNAVDDKGILNKDACVCYALEEMVYIFKQKTLSEPNIDYEKLSNIRQES